MAAVKALPIHSSRVQVCMIANGDVLACYTCKKFCMPRFFSHHLLCPHCDRHIISFKRPSSAHRRLDEAPEPTIEITLGEPTIEITLDEAPEPTIEITQVWEALRDGPFSYQHMSSSIPGMWLHGGCSQDMKSEEDLRNRQYVSPVEGQCWLRVPDRSLQQQSLPEAERFSYYDGICTLKWVVGFHRVSWDVCIQEGRVAFDWKHEHEVRYPSNILKEGVMRNGINDSNHRGVWFYLHFAHPWPPASDEIIVELAVSQSSTHKSAKWHHKYCAASEPPGAISEFTVVRAVHIPLGLLPSGLAANFS